MREILFRGKRKDNGNWEIGHLVTGRYYLDEEKITAIMPLDLTFYPRCEIDGWEDVDPDTVGQFTGLTDKNGKKIFEGDIIEWAALDELEWGPAIFGYVAFDETELAWRVYWQRYDPDWLAELHIPAVSIVGNIHDNPELLGG